MREIIPFIFWPWFFVSCFILLRRRITGGGWRPVDSDPFEKSAEKPIEFPPLPAPERPNLHPGDSRSEPIAATSPRPGAVIAPADPDRPRARTVAEAVQGIAMPCDLAPLMGTGSLDPRDVAFFTQGHPAGTVGAALANELERLGFLVSPVDDRTVNAERGADLIQVRLTSAELTSAEAMRDHHPSAPEEALVVELKLT